MDFPRQEHWRGLHLPSPGDLPDPGIEPGSPALKANSLLSEPPRKPYLDIIQYKIKSFVFKKESNGLSQRFGLTLLSDRGKKEGDQPGSEGSASKGHQALQHMLPRGQAQNTDSLGSCLPGAAETSSPPQSPLAPDLSHATPWVYDKDVMFGQWEGRCLFINSLSARIVSCLPPWPKEEAEFY